MYYPHIIKGETEALRVGQIPNSITQSMLSLNKSPDCWKDQVSNDYKHPHKYPVKNLIENNKQFNSLCVVTKLVSGRSKAEIQLQTQECEKTHLGFLYKMQITSGKRVHQGVYCHPAYLTYMQSTS